MKQWRGLKDILKIPSFVILSIIFLIGTGCFNGIATWIEKFLNESHGIPLTEVGYVSGIMILGAIIGCIVIPLISDKLMKRKPFLFMSLVGGVIFIVLMLFPSGFTFSLINSFLLGFFMISALPILMALSVEYAGERYAGISLGWLWLLGNACAVAVVPAMEMLRDATGQFTLAMLLLAVLLVVAIILTIMLKEPKLGDKK
jgi:MFS family permease